MKYDILYYIYVVIMFGQTSMGSEHQGLEVGHFAKSVGQIAIC